MVPPPLPAPPLRRLPKNLEPKMEPVGEGKADDGEGVEEADFRRELRVRNLEQKPLVLLLPKALPLLVFEVGRIIAVLPPEARQCEDADVALTLSGGFSTPIGSPK